MQVKKCAGFTIVEVVVTLAIFLIVIGAIHQIFVAGQRAWDSDLSLLDLQQSTRRGLHSVTREIRAASLESISIENNSEIEFDTPDEDNIQFFLNDDDQLIRQDSLEGQRVLAIDITDVYFNVTGGIVEVRLAAEKTVRGRVLEFSLRTKVKVRND